MMEINQLIKLLDGLIDDIKQANDVRGIIPSATQRYNKYLTIAKELLKENGFVLELKEIQEVDTKGVYGLYNAKMKVEEIKSKASELKTYLNSKVEVKASNKMSINLIKKLLFILIILILNNKLFTTELKVKDGPGMTIPFENGAELTTQIYPPIIKEVTISPVELLPNEEVTVEAKIKTVIEDGILSVILFYSIDNGNSWEKIEMEQKEEDDKKWSCIIPPQKENTKVLFYIYAIDLTGNIVTETPSSDREFLLWPPTDNNSLALICLDEKDRGVFADVDLLKIYFGYDKEYFYFKLIFDGEIKDEHLHPSGMYRIDIFNLDKGNENGKETGSMIYYRKIASAYTLPIAGRVHLDEPFSFWDQATEINSIIDKNIIYLRCIGEGLTTLHGIKF